MAGRGSTSCGSTSKTDGRGGGRCTTARPPSRETTTGSSDIAVEPGRAKREGQPGGGRPRGGPDLRSIVPIEFVAGDLFTNAHAVQAFAHGCNCQGSMGAGIATGFRDRYPAMYEQYRARCKAKPREFNLGDVWLWKADDQPWVYNL